MRSLLRDGMVSLHCKQGVVTIEDGGGGAAGSWRWGRRENLVEVAVFLGPAYSLDPGFLRSVVPPHEENARVTGSELERNTEVSVGIC